MLRRLQIKNYVLIDSLDIEFPSGLVIITGQTGAGKSIILGALSLVLGAKADTSAIGGSGDQCVVEAEFEVGDEDGFISRLLEENEVDFDKDAKGDGTLIIRRVLNRSGRSRSFVNDSPVPVKVISDIASRLLDIHSQHETMLLRDKAFQMSMIDHYAGDNELLSSCRVSWQKLISLSREYSELEESLERERKAKDYNDSLYNSLVEAKLQDGEVEALEVEQKQLANAEEIKSGMYRIISLFCPEDEERPSTDSALKDAVRVSEKLAAYIPDLSKIAERLESVRTELDDIVSDLREREASIEVSEDRLQEVDTRLSFLYSLMKRHGVADIAGLIALRDSLQKSITGIEASEERLSELKSQVESEKKVHSDICKKLHEARTKVTGKFSEEITSSIRSLEMERAVFDVVLDKAQPGPDGSDSVLFRFSSTGKSPEDVAKCASGGEMSRIMLCLKAMMARYAKMPTMIFDEIDTGVSGSVADKMGSMICAMGKYMQVFAITHLPQVAAKGDAHYIVSKQYIGDRAVTDIKKISGEERVMEIARILSGSKVSPEAIANARSLLKA